MPSRRYKQMCKELSRLKLTLLPRLRRGALLDLTPRTSVRALAYRVLSHAEIEHYLEDRATEIATATDKAWRDRRHVSEALLCLLAFSGMNFSKVPNTLRPRPKDGQKDWNALIKPDARVKSCVEDYLTRTRQKNHGIKEDNILSLLLPIGFRAEDFDELLLAELNDFGAKRGRAAHASVAGHITTGVNPLDEASQVRRIVDGLKMIDRSLDDILSRSA